jgi:hypothetical protein
MGQLRFVPSGTLPDPTFPLTPGLGAVYLSDFAADIFDCQGLSLAFRGLGSWHAQRRRAAREDDNRIANGSGKKSGRRDRWDCLS